MSAAVRSVRVMASSTPITTPITTTQALSAVAAALDAIDHGQRAGLGHEERLDLVAESRRLACRVDALAALLLQEADRARSPLIARGTPTTSWLAASGDTSAREAAASVFAGRDLVAHPDVQQAALQGEVTMKQARSIVRTLTDLPVGLRAEDRDAAARLLVTKAASTSADAIPRLATAVLAEVAPDVAARLGPEAQIEAQARRAHTRRSLSFAPDGDGSVLLRGSLPTLAAAPLIRLVDAYAQSSHRAARGTTSAEGRAEDDRRTPDQRRADALCDLVAEHQSGRRAPGIAGDRPRIVVSMSYDQLLSHAQLAGLVAAPGRGSTTTAAPRPSGKPSAPAAPDEVRPTSREQSPPPPTVVGVGPITAGDLRRLCCDADITPAVLGGQSEILDVGTTSRLVTPAIRRALSLRDGGCIFPGCDQPDVACEAHHLIPWWAGGRTAIGNMALLCPHHHGVVEPPRFTSGCSPDRWSVVMDDCGRPEVVPPRRLGPQRTPTRRAGPLERAG